MPPQVFDRAQQLDLAARCRQRKLAHVLGEIERGGIRPQRWAQAPAGCVDELPEAGHEM